MRRRESDQVGPGSKSLRRWTSRQLASGRSAGADRSLGGGPTDSGLRHNKSPAQAAAALALTTTDRGYDAKTRSLFPLGFPCVYEVANESAPDLMILFKEQEQWGLYQYPLEWGERVLTLGATSGRAGSGARESKHLMRSLPEPATPIRRSGIPDVLTPKGMWGP